LDKSRTFNWQQQGWPEATVDRRLLVDELRAFEMAFLHVKNSLQKQTDVKAVAVAMADEPMDEPIEAINEAIKAMPGVNKPSLMKKTGGYFVREVAT